MAMNSKKGYKPKQRGAALRQRKSIILISAEGKNKTETQYFKDFGKAKNRNVRFSPGNNTDPVNMVNSLVYKYTELGLTPELGDKAYCLIDADFNDVKNSQIEKADKIASDNDIHIIMSAPCFEVWCLCHYTCSSKQFNNNDEVIEMLRKHLPRYKKDGMGLYETLSFNTKSAIENAKKLEKYCYSTGRTKHTVAFSPSTEIYRIAEELLR